MHEVEHKDVLVVGAGLSGIGAGYHLQSRCPRKSYAILEGRDAIGGTWDLFRYPGIRSDSDMYTLGYAFRPWRGAKSIADGPSILAYIRDTAREYGIDRKIRFGHRVAKASWSSEQARWTVEATRKDGELARFTCDFLLVCSGYYDYERGYTPDFPGVDRFAGRLVHPQHWPKDLDHEGKRVVVIGSGATAVTLVPELARRAARVTMLQRSPTYILSLPAVDPAAAWLRKTLPEGAAYEATRWKNVLVSMAMYNFCRRFPDRAKKLLVGGVRKSLGDDFDVDTHFTPSYGPWDQRLCLVPDGDLFEAIKGGRADVVTDHVETFTETGLRLRSGRTLDADVVVTATGLRVQLLGKMEIAVDGRRVDVSKTLTYKGAMFSDVPNLAMTLGYTNASWTLKCDLTCRYVCRLLEEMDRGGYRVVVARRTDPDMQEEPVINFSSGYVRRALSELPRQGSKVPWRLHQNYALDLLGLRYGPLKDEALELTRA